MIHYYDLRPQFRHAWQHYWRQRGLRPRPLPPTRRLEVFAALLRRLPVPPGTRIIHYSVAIARPGEGF